MRPATDHRRHTEGQHLTDSLGCWCVPDYGKPCFDCEGGCPFCDAGLISITRAEAEARSTTGEAIIVVHHR